MAQLNVLPVKVSQNIDTKDDSARLNTGSSKDDFSQHIDLHLMKNKGEGYSKKNANSENTDTKVAITPHEKNNVKTDDDTPAVVAKNEKSTDDTNSASNTQKVAASGKNPDKESSTEKNNEVVDESELLMSFLIKADKALVNDESIDNMNASQLTPEQKAHYEAQLLLKSSDQVADLSTIAKALNGNGGGDSELSSEQEKIAKALVALSEKNHTTPDNKSLPTDKLAKGDVVDTAFLAGKNQEGEDSIEQLLTDKSLGKENTNKLASDGKTLSNELLKNENNKINQQLSTEKLTQTSANDTIDNNKVTATVQQLINNELSVKASDDSVTDNDELNLAELSKQKPVSESKNIETNNDKLISQSTKNLLDPTRVTNNAEVSLETDEQSIEKNAELTMLTQNKPSAEKAEKTLTSTIVNGQDSKTPFTDTINKASAVSNTKENVPTQPETPINTKSAEQIVEESEINTTDENKETNNKSVQNTSTNFSINNSFTEGTSRATQATRDIIDQHVAEVFNPTGSAEVSQSQKTNTQLHHETISIFRKDFADAVKDKVMVIISQKLQQFEITLDPPEFGNMQVRVNMQGEQATVNFIVQNQQAKEVFEQNMHKLKDLLAEQGVDVGDANVEQQSNNDANDGDNSAGDQHNAMTSIFDGEDAIEHSLSAKIINSPTTAVDYYA